jgi:5'-methylthioadenosine phosphorylase
MSFAIVGGSGLSGFAEVEVSHREVVRTPYGEPSGPLTFGRLAGTDVVFLPRHGYGHTLPPHDINYRANVWALHHVGASAIVSVASVGGIRDDLPPGGIAVLDQIIDYTWGRASTYFDSPDMPVTHIDFTHPFDAKLRQRLIECGRKLGETLATGGVYACTQGPRLETAAEINRLARDGADVVGMTLMPEAALARELEIPYVALAVIVNHAAGRGDSKLQISTDEIGRTLDATMARIRALITEFLKDIAIEGKSAS